MNEHMSTEAGQPVIERAQAETAARRNVSAASVPPLFRFQELKPLEPWQRSAVIKQASALANREPLGIALCGTWLALLVALAFISPAWFHGLAVSATVLFFVVPFLIYRRARVRHHVRQLLRARADGSQA